MLYKLASILVFSCCFFLARFSDITGFIFGCVRLVVTFSFHCTKSTTFILWLNLIFFVFEIDTFKFEFSGGKFNFTQLLVKETNWGAGALLLLQF